MESLSCSICDWQSADDLHDHFVGAADDRMLHLFQIVFHHVETVDALLEVLRQRGEEGRDFGVFEVLELGDNVVAFLPGLHPFNKILETLAAKPEVVDAWGTCRRRTA